MLKISETLMIGYDESKEDEVKLLTISRYNGNKLEMINFYTGETAKELYILLKGEKNHETN